MEHILDHTMRKRHVVLSYIEFFNVLMSKFDSWQWHLPIVEGQREQLSLWLQFRTGTEDREPADR